MKNDLKLLTQSDIQKHINMFPERISTMQISTLVIPLGGNYEKTIKSFVRNMRKQRKIIYFLRSNDDLIEAIIGDDLQESSNESQSGGSVF